MKLSSCKDFDSKKNSVIRVTTLAYSVLKFFKDIFLEKIRNPKN